MSQIEIITPERIVLKRVVSLRLIIDCGSSREKAERLQQMDEVTLMDYIRDMENSLSLHGKEY